MFRQTDTHDAAASSRVHPPTAPGAIRRLPPGRSPALTDAACALRDGRLTRADYWHAVDLHKPVRTYMTVPEPCTAEALALAVDASKRHKANMAGTAITPGQQVCLRLDIPAFTRHGAWVICIHEPKGKAIGAVLAYESCAVLEDAHFRAHEDAAFKVACGAAKSPMAAIAGRYAHRTADQVLAEARDALARPEWVQLGYDPERRSFFYDRSRMRPVVHAARIVQCGALILARDPAYGDERDHRY